MDPKTTIAFSTMAIAAVAIVFALGPIIETLNQAFAYGGYGSIDRIVGHGSYTIYVGYHHHHHHHHHPYHHYYGGGYGGGYGPSDGGYGGGYGPSDGGYGGGYGPSDGGYGGGYGPSDGGYGDYGF